MRAFAIDEFGAAGSIHEMPEPTPGEGEVRVRVEAAAINPVDVIMMSGAYKDFMEHRFPFIPGLDLAGTVDLVGPGVAGLRIGDPVFGSHGKRFVGEGTLAQYAVASAATLARRPEAIDAASGAALSLVGVAALLLIDAAALQPGDAALIIGAAGGIGSVALQLTAAAGATPIAVTRAVNHEYVRGLGAAEVIDYEHADVHETVRAAHPHGIAAIFDLVGDKAANARLAELVRRGGHLLSMAGGADVEALGARGITGANIQAQVTTEKLERLASLVDSGTIRPPEIQRFRIDDAGQALGEVAGHHVRGKLVVLPQGLTRDLGSWSSVSATP